jgi:hypothetical protein
MKLKKKLMKKLNTNPMFKNEIKKYKEKKRKKIKEPH